MHAQAARAMSAKRMLGTVGTEWSSTPAKRTDTKRCCNKCEPRKPVETSQAKYNCNRPACNGTRKAGEYGFTWCHTMKRHYTLCGRCSKSIEPHWYLSLTVRTELFEKNTHLKEVLELNEAAYDNDQDELWLDTQ